MTEDEANQRQCCGPEGCGVFNDRPHPARWCVGSTCMAWRWGQKPNPAFNPMQANMWPALHPPVPMYIPDRESGGCGLAGPVQ